MHHTRIFAPVALLFALTCAFPASSIQAQDGVSPWSVGLQSSWPAYGLSARYDLSERTQFQGVLGALGTVTSLGARVNRTFKDEPKYDVIGFGAVGLWRYGYFSSTRGRDLTESSIGIGGGAGFEFDLAELFSPEDDDFPALFWSIELGLTYASFDNYSWSAFGLGGGLHYRF